MWLPLRVLASAWGMAWLLAITLPLCLVVLIAWLLRVPDHRLQWAPRWWARLLMGGIGCRVRIRGLENLQPGATYVFAGNHSSALDIPALQAVLPSNFRWVAKKELFRIPVFGQALRAVGDISIDRSASRQAMQSLLQAAGRVKSEASVVIFPEGTRSDDGKLLPFKSGGFLLAIKSQRPVVPFYLLGTRQALKNDGYLLNPRPIQVVCGRPIAVEGFQAGDRERLSALVRERILALQAELEGPAQVDTVAQPT